MSQRRDLATIVVVLLLLTGGAVADVSGPSHFAPSGVTYQTNSGLEVTLSDDRDIAASPFADDQTFASEGVELQAPGTASATISDQTFADTADSMAVTQIDASQSPVRLSRSDLSSDVTVEDGDASVILHEVALDDGATDLEVVANTATNVTVENVPDVGGIQAVDASGEPVAGETDTSDGTVTLSLDPGEYDLRLQDGPAELTIRDLTTQDVITDENVTVDVQFFGNDGSVEEREPVNGVVDMTGLPADERFSVSVDANDSYVQRQIIIPSLINQRSAYLLPQDTAIETVEPRFTLEDPSNQFDPERSEIVLERPLDTPNGTEFVAVAGDRIGLNGFDTILERDQRYRVTVTDPESGAQRELGEFTPTQSEPVTLTVQDIEFNSVSETEGLDWTARYLESEDSTDEVEFIYRDDLDTVSVEYRIFERGNESNVLVDSSASGNVTVRESVPPDEQATVWQVEFNATRSNGETITATRPVSTNELPVGPGLASEWQTGFALFGLIAIAGLFGAVNPGVGGIAVAAAGGMFYLVGWLPDTTGGIMVILALFVAVLSYAGRKARGATA